MDTTELFALSELSSQLKPADILQIRDLTGIPAGLCEDVTQGIIFINAIKKWNRHNPFQFYQALESTRSDLIAVACKIPWLCVSSPSECEQEGKELTIKSLIDLLKSNITKGQWLMIYMVVTNEAGDNIGFEITLNKMLEKGLIERGLTTLSEILKGIQRDDLVDKLRAYQAVFSGMEDGEFKSKFKRELLIQSKEMQQWEYKLKQFIFVQHEKVKQMIGSDESVSLAHVYIDLTILKQKPKPIDLKDETTYNEIAFLRKIANREVEISPVDFTEELISYKPTQPEIWCLIGNPGCGKTFLAKRTALRFSSNELAGILYSISIPCRNPDWHAMEFTRHEEEKQVDSEFIQKWLLLGLPIGSSWSVDLAKHLNESDGEGLLLIIDGLDEYTKKIPFEKTFLCLLLTRQSLPRCTIILTSRPGAWTDISSSHELKIDRYYQVLGFSPVNRDLYFTKQLQSETKLKECMNLLARYDEINQLSLIPVNASLFAALLRGEDSTSINTLAKLYHELTLYLIRRELTRLSLGEFSRVTRISYLHADILECLYRIAFIAFLGVANRDLTSDETVPLIIGEEEYTGHCLGLAHEHYKRESVGLIKKVWTFPHLTMQEFTAALWLDSSPWTEQCFSVRYISHSSANFSLFRMIVRFLCGLLREKSAAVLSILYRYLTPQTIQLTDIPMCYQLRYDYIDTHNQGWNEFSEVYFQMTAILYETDSNSIPVWFAHFKQFFPDPIYIFINTTISPNEWICFLQSLQLVSEIQLIYIETDFINPTQFKFLIQNLVICSVQYLALEFYDKDSTTVLPYIDLIRETDLLFGTRISLELKRCDLTGVTTDNPFLLTTNQNIYSMKLFYNKYSNEFLLQLNNQFSVLEYLYLFAPEKLYNPQTKVYEESGVNYDTLVPALCQLTQLRGLYLYCIPNEYTHSLKSVLPQFSNLQEIGFSNASLLPAISKLTNITYLKIEDNETEDTNLSDYLTQLINANGDTLRGVELYCLEEIGFMSWEIFLNCLASCTNLVRLEIRSTRLPADDVSQWSNTVSKLKSLVELVLLFVSLYDTGLISVCGGLIKHPAIRKLDILSCNLTSLSCLPLIHFIPTVYQLESLTVDGLSEQEQESIKLLTATADEYCIEHDLS